MEATLDAAQRNGSRSEAPATGSTGTARVRVTLKPVVNDPAGLSIAQALDQLGFDAVGRVRTGKYFEIELAAPDKAAAEQATDRMCRQLLANPVVERYTYSVAQSPRRR